MRRGIVFIRNKNYANEEVGWGFYLNIVEIKNWYYSTQCLQRKELDGKFRLYI